MIPLTALLKVGLLSTLKVSKTAADNSTLDNALLFLLPHGFVFEVHVTADIMSEASHFL